MASELPSSKHWTLREPRSLSWKKQRELAIQRATFHGYVWCPFGHWVERKTAEPHVHHVVKDRHWVDPAIFPSLAESGPYLRPASPTRRLPLTR